MKVLLWSHGENLRLRIETLPVLLMNYQWSREQKWNPAWVSTVSTRTFRKDPKCDVCLKTKITTASCRRRAGTVVPRADIFGDLTTADRNILSGSSESRNNHRYAVVVQDLATQWLQSYPCRTKTCQETQKNLKKSWSRRGHQKSFTLTIPWNLASLVRNYLRIIVRQRHSDRKLMGLPIEQCVE